MTLLDRYLLKLFAGATAISFVALLSLFIIIDFATNVIRFFAIEETAVLGFIAEYYLVRIPLFTNYILPVVVLFAAVFSMVRLSRTNEILPMVVTGTSLRRVTVPLFVAALAAAGVTFAIEEFLLPEVAERLARTDEILLSEKFSWRKIAYGDQGTLLEASQYNHHTYEMANVRITQINPSGRKRLVVLAKHGAWNETEKGWSLTGGSTMPFDDEGNPLAERSPEGRPVVRKDPFPPGGIVFRCEIEPRDLRLRSHLTGESLTLSELHARAAKFPHIPSIRMELQLRYSFPLVSLTLLLIGIPVVAVPTAHSYLKGLLVCFMLVVIFYAAHFLLLDYGERGKLSPFAAAWGTTIGFGGVGLFFFARMRT